MKKQYKRRLKLERLELRLAMAGQVFTDVASDSDVWELRPRIPATQGSVSYLQPSEFSAAILDLSALAAKLASAPMEFTSNAQTTPLQISLPTPSHSFARFAVVQSPIMDPALAAQFPEIQTYSGQGIDDPAATLRFDITPAGFHAQVISPNGAYYIDPYWHLEQSVYVSYFKHDLAPRVGEVFEEGLISEFNTIVKASGQEVLKPELSKDSMNVVFGNGIASKGDGSIQLARSGSQLRTYRLANAATGEYTAFHGGTVALGQSAIVTAINRVTGIYESELSVRLVLVANNSTLVYTNSATDPYTNGDSSLLLTQNQSNLDAVIGNANYDIGHVFSTGGGGLADLGVVGVAGRKAQGETGLSSPIGDAFYVDYVAHEMGHQFGGNHTFNGVTGSCSGGNRNGATAYEPGSGSTIQAYAGICGLDNLQPHSDPYFHSLSFDEISAYTTTGVGNAAAAISTTGNSVPRIDAGPDFVIPARTAFALNAGGADADPGDMLTYNWEQRDLGVAQAVSAQDNGSSPIFRSFNPTLSPERILPRLNDLLNNSTTTGEKLPTTTRTLKFRATVRDNRSGGGGVNSDDAQVSVIDTGAAFSVTSPNTAITWAGNSTHAVTWNVAGTTAAPISTSKVNIWLSTNGGNSFPILLAANTPNDGSEEVVIPDVSTIAARIKIEAANSIYFDVSDLNFTIAGGTNTPPVVSEVLNRLIDSNSSTGPISFTISDGQTAATDLVVSATSSNSVLVPDAAIVLAGTGANRTISVTPAPGQFGQTTISIQVTDANGLKVQENFLLFVAGVLACNPYQDFDSVTVPSLPSGWTTSASGVVPTEWVTSNSSSAGGPNNAFVPNPQGISDSRFVTPVISLTQANSQFRFQNNYNLEDTFDGGVIEISVDGGSFTDLVAAGGRFLAGGYNGTIDPGSSSPLAGRSAWTGNSGGYVNTIAEFPPSSIGKNVQLRMRMGSDESIAAVGWRVDSTQICGIPNPPINSTIATRGVFYNGATGTSASTSLATDKIALLPGQASSYANYTNYSRGLNGVVFDVVGLPASTSEIQMAASLQFSTWNGIDAAGFVALPSANVASVHFVPGGVSGSTRVQIVFLDNTVQNTWLKVEVASNLQTNLAAKDVFYFGNVIGEFNVGNTATRLRVNAQDTFVVRSNQSTLANSVDVTNIYDLNRDGRVNAEDTALVRLNQQIIGIVAPITASSNPRVNRLGSSEFGLQVDDKQSTYLDLNDQNSKLVADEMLKTKLGAVDEFFALMCRG